MEMAKRTKATDMTKGMKRWCVRVALDDEDALVARSSALVQLKELVDGGTATLLVGHVVDQSAHFNALEQLSRMLSKERIWSGVLPAGMAQGIKQLVVYVARCSSTEEVAKEIQRMTAAVGLELALNATRCEGNVPHFVIDTLVATALMNELESTGCTVFGDLAEHQVVLSGDPFAEQISTIAMPRIEWRYDPYRQSCSIEMTCIPAVMKLKTIAEDHEMEDDSSDEDNTSSSWTSTSRVRVLPRMSEGWVVSRIEEDVYYTSASNEWGRETRSDVTQLPRTEDEFRSYWLQVHGIRLPECFGGYARVRFSSKSVLTYPACCVATQWQPLPKQTRLEGLDVVRGFAALMRQLFGTQSVSITSPDDQQDKTVVLLPASALLNAETTQARHVRNDLKQYSKPHTKRRMISRDRYAAV